MSHRNICIVVCLALCVVFVVAFSSRLFPKEPFVSSQLFVVNEDGTKQEIAPTEQKKEGLNFIRNLREDLEQLEWVNEAIVLSKYDDEVPMYQITVIHDSRDESRYEDLLFWLNQYIGSFSVNDEAIYEGQIQLTIVVE